jgi:hypothetical protein
MAGVVMKETLLITQLIVGQKAGIISPFFNTPMVEAMADSASLEVMFTEVPLIRNCRDIIYVLIIFQLMHGN